ncbi:cleavage and polyadenylation specificity factor subunit 2 isoform X1 [Tanacetum coccineum]
MVTLWGTDSELYQYYRKADVLFHEELLCVVAKVEFSCGALRCGEYVTLRKVRDASHKGGAAAIQHIVNEGPICEEYYKIRKYLYS